MGRAGSVAERIPRIPAGFVRQRNPSLSDAWQAHELAEGLLGGHEYTVGGERVLQLVAQSPCSAYDREYVALADDLAVPLVTADRQVLRQFPRIAVSPAMFLQRTA